MYSCWNTHHTDSMKDGFRVLYPLSKSVRFATFKVEIQNVILSVGRKIVYPVPLVGVKFTVDYLLLINVIYYDVVEY